MIPLKKSNVQEKIVIQITDTHLMDNPQATFVEINPELSFHTVIEDILEKYPEIDCRFAKDFKPLFHRKVDTQSAEIRSMIRESMRKNVKIQ